MPSGERPLEWGNGPLLRFAAGLRSLRRKAGNPTLNSRQGQAGSGSAASNDRTDCSKLNRTREPFAEAFVRTLGRTLPSLRPRPSADTAASSTPRCSGDPPRLSTPPRTPAGLPPVPERPHEAAPVRDDATAWNDTHRSGGVKSRIASCPTPQAR